MGRIAARGVGRIAVGVSNQAPSQLKLTLSAKRTIRQATSSAPVAVSPDGAEVWAVVPDADKVVIVDSSTDKRVGDLPISGHPTSVSITPDGAFVLVAASRANTVTVIDRAARKVVQTLGEADGIGREPRHLVVSPDGGHAFVSSYVGDTVTSLIRNEKRYWVEGNIAVRRRPMALSVFPDSETVIVSHFLPEGTTMENLGHVSVISAPDLTVKKDLVFQDTLNLEKAKCLADVFAVQPIRMVSEGVASQLWGVFLDPAGTRGWMPGTRVAGQPVVERGPNAAELNAAFSPRPGELAPPFIFFIDARNTDEPEEQLSIGNVERPVADSYLQCEKFGAETEFVARTLIPGKEDQQVNRFPAFPTGSNGLTDLGMVKFIGFTRGGRRALVLSHMSDELALFDATTLHPSTQHHFTLSGQNPSGFAVLPNGKKAYVVYDNSVFASVVDLSAYADSANLPKPQFVPYEYRDVPEVPAAGAVVSSQQMVRYIGNVPDLPDLQETAQITLVDSDPMSPALRRGKVLFESSNPDKYPSLTQSRLGTCASCHPGGGNDGTLWATMEGERRTTSLYGGVAGRGWLHAQGTHHDVTEFATVVVTERLGGNLSPDDTDALAQWVAFGIPKIQTPTVDETLAEQGKGVFEQKCAGCHMGEKFTSGNPDPDNEFGGGKESGPIFYNVGTLSENSHVLIGTFFESLFPPLESQLLKELRGDRDLGDSDFVQETLDFRPRPNRKAVDLKAPALVNVWDNAVFFHDGRYDNLNDVIKHLNDNLSLDLSAADQKAVIEYVKTL
ncbi:MAG: hypothetical protein IPK82_37115 [Polyangiaceae bacterium]|nr:hypothetical protein [Polyangiaceae bacterium]